MATLSPENDGVALIAGNYSRLAFQLFLPLKQNLRGLFSPLLRVSFGGERVCVEEAAEKEAEKEASRGLWLP